VELQCEGIAVDLDTALPCGLIVNELVSNALKYAFAGVSAGRIDIGLVAQKDKTITLRVADNGVGMPEEFDFHNSASLGLKLVEALAHQLGGELTCTRRAGTVFTITFTPKSLVTQENLDETHQFTRD